MAKHLVILPTYNEAENIRDVLNEVSTSAPGVEILVVDDTSPDGTAERVREFAMTHPHVHLTLRAQKEGLAKAYLTGLAWGIEHGYDILVQMDADLSHNPKDVLRLIKALEHADVAVGSRYIPGGGTLGWTLPRRMISRGGNLYARFVLGTTYEDMTGGFNAWKRASLEKINFQTVSSRGYAFQIEMKYRAHKKGLRIIEVPINFKDRIRGISKMTGSIVYEAAWKVFEIKKNA